MPRTSELAHCNYWTPKIGALFSVALTSRRIVWTLPPALHVPGVDPVGYVAAAERLVANAQHALVIVAPYLEQHGIGQLEPALLNALSRGVSVALLTHEVEVLNSFASQAVQGLRRESVGLHGRLTVYSASESVVDLLHLKIVVADSTNALLGSANLTAKGFGRNLEAGCFVGPEDAHEMARVFQAVIASGMAAEVFSNQPGV